MVVLTKEFILKVITQPITGVEYIYGVTIVTIFQHLATDHFICDTVSGLAKNS
jgi:hypothetical protein